MGEILRPTLHDALAHGRPIKFQDMEKAFYKGKLKVNDEVFERPFDVNFSGSTCVSIILVGNKVYCGNVGDSRAVLISYSE
jgi:serine/threonine protein phosphatase PrpC